MKSYYDVLKSKPWFSKFNNNMKLLSPEKKFSLLIALVVFITIFIIFTKIVNQNNKVDSLSALQNKRSQVILSELNYFHSALENLKNNPINTNQQNAEIQMLEKNLTAVQQSISSVAKSSEILIVSKQINSVKDDMDTQMNQIQKSISQNLGNKQYLDADALPFNVVAIDVIAEQPYITVDYANHIFPLSVGDLLAGWRAQVADYDAGVAEFVNDRNQYVKVALHGA